MCFSSDGQYVLSGSNNLELWQVNTGKLVRTFSGNYYPVSWVDLSPDSRYALSRHYDSVGKQWNIDTGQPVRTFTKTFYDFRGSYVNTLRAWESNEAKKFQPLSGHNGTVISLSFSADGRYVLTSGYDKKVKVWDVRTGKDFRTFSVHGSSPSFVRLSSDGHYALSQEYNGNNIFYKIRDVNTGKEIYTLAKNNHVYDISADSRYILVSIDENNNSSLNLLSISTGKKVYSFAQNNHEIYPACLSADNRYALSTNSDNVLKLWKVSTGEVVKKFIGHTDKVNSLCLSADGRYALSSSKDKTLKLWNISTGQKVHPFIGHTGNVHTICMSSDGRYALSADESTVKLWDVSSGKELKSWSMNYFPIKVAFAPGGSDVLVGTTTYFVSFPIPKSVSPKPVLPLPTPPFSQLVESIDTKPISPTLSTSVFSQIIWHGNPTTVHEPAYSAQAVFVSNYANPIEASHIRVYVNGQLQAAGQKMGITSLKANQGRYNWEQTLPLMEGGNEIVLGLLLPNQPEVRSEPLAITYLPPTRPNLYVVNIGVSGAGLDYAANDAKQIGELFKKQQGKLFNKVTVFPLYEKGQTNTTRLRKEMSRLSLYGITPNDVLIIFASAHGKKLNLRNGQTDFALQPDDYDNANLSSEETTTLLYRGHVLTNIEDIVCKKLILFDACHSGEAVHTQGSKSQYLRDLRDAQEIVKNAPPGIITLASSSDGQLSWEDSSWQHGAFTKALLDGLNGAADTDKDHFVSINELFIYIKKMVPNLLSKVDRLKQEKQEPQMYPKKLPDNADFPLVQY
ncbi:caspase family protein [Spirosoma litoris]